MLNSLTRSFNETVFRGPDDEGGSGDVETLHDGGIGDGGGDDHATGGDDGVEGGEDQKPLSVREQLKKSIAEVSEQDAAKTGKRDKTTGRFGERKPKGQEAAPAEGAAAPAAQTAVVEPPASLPKELKAEWDKAPPAIQQAFLKREQDMANGVAELKGRYAQIDQAIAPHTDALRQMNASPGDAVNRMFLWFKALASNPVNSFPELAKSMGIDWAKLTAPKGQGVQQPVTQDGQPVAPGAPEIPEPVKQYVGGLEQKVAQLTNLINQVGGRFGSIEQNINSQNEARTLENLTIWSKDKPHFQDVRQDMAKLIETGVVPLKNGQVDLDTAYERAIYFNPEVRAKVLAEQQQANLQVQQESKAAATTAQATQVNRARKASVSLPASSTPGAANGAVKQKPGQKLSVRDSIKAAVAQVREQ